MGISQFLMLVMVFTIVFLFVEKDQTIQKVQKEEKPIVSFYDSIMYEITESQVEQIVKSKQADIYDKREELIDGTIVTKADENSFKNNIVSGDNIVKRDNDIYFEGAVNLQLANGTNIKTEKLHYNTKTKIAKNNVNFSVIRNNGTVDGRNLYLDSIKEHIKAENTKFRMKVNNE
jgi:hypothetical protein